MKTKLLVLLAVFSLSATFHAQSIEITSDITSATQVGDVFTVDYKYTHSGSDYYIFAGINLLDDWTWVSYVGGEGLNPAPAGTDVTGTFNITIPSDTKPTAELTGNLNYKINIEIKQYVEGGDDNWIKGTYPETGLTFTEATLSVNDLDLQDKVKMFYANQKINVSGLDVSDEYTLSVYDLTGREVLSFNSKESKAISLPSSLYIARLRVNNSQSITKKILIP